MKKITSILLVACLIIPCAFMLTGCDGLSKINWKFWEKPKSTSQTETLISSHNVGRFEDFSFQNETLTKIVVKSNHVNTYIENAFIRASGYEISFFVWTERTNIEITKKDNEIKSTKYHSNIEQVTKGNSTVVITAKQITILNNDGDVLDNINFDFEIPLGNFEWQFEGYCDLFVEFYGVI